MTKHTPYTSEPSNPHTSKSEPKEHVDIHHYGEGGKKDDSMTVPHVTDKDAVNYGKDAERVRQDQSNKK